MRPWLSCLLMAVFLAACDGDGGDVASAPTVQVFKIRGAIQCEGGGTAPEVMQHELTSAGIAVVAFACGDDGLAHVALCGAPDGRINIFDIPQHKAAQAQALGFARLSSLPSAREIPCT